MGCEAPIEQPVSSEREVVGTQQQPFASAGIDRVIPIRFVMIKDAGEQTPAGYAAGAYASVARANDIFRPAGIQFYARALDAYQTDKIYTDYGGSAVTARSWTDISSNFSMIFSQATSTSFSGDPRPTIEWMLLAAERWARSDEVLVYVTPGTTRSYFPFTARNMEVARGNLASTMVFAHELGHFFGLGHPFLVSDDPSNIHPQTGSGLVLTDWWDQTYIPGTPTGASHYYPTSKVDADTAASQTGRPVRRINNNFSVSPNSYCQREHKYVVYENPYIPTGNAVPMCGSRHVCSSGFYTIPATCNSCVSDVCSTHPGCCNVSWTASCVGLAQQRCGVVCSGNCATDQCSHRLSEVGGPLVANCSTCAAAVCQLRPSCCSTNWDLECIEQANASCSCGFTGSNCCQPKDSSSGVIQCEVGGDVAGSYTEVISTGDAGMKALAFTTSQPDNPPTSYRYAPNVMDYLQGYTDYPSQLSSSQVAMVRNYLRYEVPMTYEFMAGKPSGRTKLGSYPNRRPAQKVDLDGDGKRDIVMWSFPAGGTAATFRIWRSNTPFAYVGSIDIPFGQAGDIPILSDFNGDGLTDLGVYRVMESGTFPGLGQWSYCTITGSSSGISCSATSSIVFGNRGDVPLADTNFIAGPELALFTPSTGQWSWRPVATNTVTTRTLGGPGSVILPGLYDTDQYTDLVVYDAYGSTYPRFSMKLSGSSWSTQLDRNFPVDLRANHAGTSSAERAAAIPIPGMQFWQIVGSAPPYNIYGNRQALSLWDPATGNWSIMWQPTLNSPSITTCQWGDVMDVPIAHLGSSTNQADAPYNKPDPYSKLSVLRPWTDGNSYLYTRAGGTTCGAPDSGKTHTGRDYEYQVFSVADMFGDGLPELWEYLPSKQTLYVYSSADNYATPTMIPLGGFRGYLL